MPRRLDLTLEALSDDLLCFYQTGWTIQNPVQIIQELSSCSILFLLFLLLKPVGLALLSGGSDGARNGSVVRQPADEHPQFLTVPCYTDVQLFGSARDQQHRAIWQSRAHERAKAQFQVVKRLDLNGGCQTQGGRLEECSSLTRSHFGLVTYDTHSPSIHAGKSNHNVLGIVGHDLEEIPLIHYLKTYMRGNLTMGMRPEVADDWLPGVVALPDRGGILIAERQEVEELSEVEEGLHVILKRMMSHT
ncbi:hypothetical protein INR49_031378 [Caranx melampygus]|nr:hypothetical protein INR49_031378 [Caranx melampygus]